MRRRGTRRRRQASSARSYSLPYLLSRQPKSLAKHELYGAMMVHLRASGRLAGVRFSRRCYTLLNQARIAPHNLVHFYRTYKLPKDPFFPLFFTIKRDYLAERERIKEERRHYILTTMRALAPPVLAQIKYLGYLECHFNAAGRSPVWEKHIFPTSRKQVDGYSRFSPRQWHAVYRRHLSRLSARYPGIRGAIADRVLACFVLGITPEKIPPVQPSPAEVARVYRRLSLLHHPDRGGHAETFISIKKARDLLVGA